jgi:branched-chain amino acid transport system permease protein
VNLNSIALAVLNALSLAMLLFLLAAGLSITFGLMRVLNMANSSFFLIGAYIGLSIWTLTGNFVLALIVGAVSMGLAGMLLFSTLLRRFSREEELPQALLTFGVVFVAADLALITWGGNTQRLPPPDYLAGAVFLGPVAYPKYRFFLIVFGLFLAGLLYLGISRTRLGAMIRAGEDDTETAQALGINIPRARLLVFGFGSLLAGLGGVLGAPYLGIYPGEDLETMLLAFAVVIVGGTGSIEGAFFASVIVALTDTLAKTYVPALSYFSIYAPMALILAFRPSGLLGRRA